MEKKLSIKTISGWTASRLVSGSPDILTGGVSTDSRTTGPGEFFIPVRGENFDGHDFIRDAVRNGACGFVYSSAMKDMVDKWKESIPAGDRKRFPVIETSDTLGFLEELARNYIKLYSSLKVIGITGSVGKTTTRNFLTAVLSTAYRVQSTPKNYNTEIGISKTILELKENTDFLVVELGMRGKGQIGFLADLCGVSMGAITAIGNSHMQFFKDIKEIALAKAEIAGSITKAGGVLFLNADDEMTGFIKKNVSCLTREFGRNGNHRLNFIEKGADRLGRFSFDLYDGDTKITGVKLGIPGIHNVYNACCAAAMGHYLGINGSLIKSGLENAIFEDSRMELIEHKDIVILNDCYNASPLSVYKAADTLQGMSNIKKGRRVAILGDMLELGPESDKLHFETGRYLGEKDIDVLIALGKLSKNTYEGFISTKTGRSRRCGYHFENKEELCREICLLVKTGDIILVKGSRAGRMEDVVELILKKTG